MLVQRKSKQTEPEPMSLPLNHLSYTEHQENTIFFSIHPPSPFADVINGWYLRRIRKGSLPSNDEKQTNQQQPFRFPAFEVIDIRPDIAPTNALDRLWLRVTAPHFNSQVDLKVSE